MCQAPCRCWGNNTSFFLKEWRVLYGSESSGQEITVPRWKCSAGEVCSQPEQWWPCTVSWSREVVIDVPKNFKTCSGCLSMVEWGGWRGWSLEDIFYWFLETLFFRYSFWWRLGEHPTKMHVLLSRVSFLIFFSLLWYLPDSPWPICSFCIHLNFKMGMGHHKQERGL